MPRAAVWLPLPCCPAHKSPLGVRVVVGNTLATPQRHLARSVALHTSLTCVQHGNDHRNAARRPDWRELLEQALRVLEPTLLGVDLDFRVFDLSLESRRATGNRIVLEAADAMVACGYGLKAATVTPERAGDIENPNALLRERVGGKVILRTGRPIPGVPGIAGISAPISVVRMAVDDAYTQRSGANLSAVTSWRFARNAFHAPRVALSRNSRFIMPSARSRACSAAPSTRCRVSTKECSRRRWMPRPRAIPMSVRAAADRRTLPCSSAVVETHS